MVDRESVDLDAGADVRLDVDEFRLLTQAWASHGHPETGVCRACLIGLTQAVELYRGDFLEGLRLRDSASFDDWQFFQTEGLRQRLAGALERLVRGHTAQATYQEMLFA